MIRILLISLTLIASSCTTVNRGDRVKFEINVQCEGTVLSEVGNQYFVGQATCEYNPIYNSASRQGYIKKSQIKLLIK
jgi:hypothetical protein